MLCLGAHSDDIEIGCAGTLLRWIRERNGDLEVTWVVLSALDERATEARRSARSLLRGASRVDVVLGEFADGLLPAEFKRAKQFFSGLASDVRPDIVFSHFLGDRHQDHRLIGELTWQTWRRQVVLEYEIPKYEGDLAQPNCFVPLPKQIARRKVGHLLKHFATQRSKDWFSEETFLALMRLRGIESRAESGYAEAFHARKFCL